MSENAEIHAKVLGFLMGEWARKEGRQLTGVDLFFAPGNGFRDEEIRKWVRSDEPELFAEYANIEKLVTQILEIAEGEADAKTAGKHRFVVRTHQHLGGRATQSFALSPGFSGGDETALVASGGGGGLRQDVIANHAGQLMRINAQMFEGTIRVLGQQNMSLHQQVSTLTAENATLRVELEEARSNKMDREFQIAMAAEKNARTNAGFQKLLQIGTVVAAKIGGADENQSGPTTSLAMLVSEFGKSLRQEQMVVLMNTLDMGQKIMFGEIMNMISASEQRSGAASNGATPNGAAPP
jgi:hypothetical protein